MAVSRKKQQRHFKVVLWSYDKVIVIPWVVRLYVEIFNEL